MIILAAARRATLAKQHSQKLLHIKLDNIFSPFDGSNICLQKTSHSGQITKSCFLYLKQADGCLACATVTRPKPVLEPSRLTLTPKFGQFLAGQHNHTQKTL